MSNIETDNIYLILELFLDPPQTGFPELQDELNKKLPGWNKLKSSSDPKYAHIAQLAHTLIKQTHPPEPPQKTLVVQAHEARKIRMKALTDAVKAYEADGILEEDELDRAIKEFSRFFTESTIRSQFSLPPQKFHEPKQPVLPDGVKEVSRPEMNKIEEDLKILGKTDLYDLLGGFVRTTDLKTLQDARNAAYQTAFKKQGKNNTIVDAEMRVLGRADIIFKTQASRQGYDLALKRRPFDELIKSTFEKIARKKTVSHDEYLFSIKKAREIGFSHAEAEWYVYEYYCKQKKCTPPKKPVEIPPRQQCAECFHLSDIKAKICGHCGIPLRIECPRCKLEGRFGDMACTQCGFPIGNMPNALRCLEKAKNALIQNDLEETERLLRQVNVFWKNIPGAEEVRQNLKELKNRQSEIQKNIKILETRIRELIGKRFLYEVCDLFKDLRKIPEAASVLLSEEEQVTNALKEVREKLQQLSVLETNQQKIDLCEDILDTTADCQQVKTALAKFPPLPPENLTARLTKSGTVELSWKQISSRRPQRFVVVRKIGASPSSVKDGTILNDDLVNTTFVDSSCEMGVIYGYAVFTKRGDLIESCGCRSELVQNAGDLSNIDILPGNKTLTFSWKQPDNCIGVKVTRFEKTSRFELPYQRQSGFVDTDLENGREYVYLFQAVFRGIDNQEILTSGTKVSSKPQLPPPVVDDLRYEKREEGDIFFHWTPPQRGEIVLYDLPFKPDSPVGKVESTNLFELKSRFGEPLPILDSEEGQTPWQNMSSGMRYVLPVTFHDGLAAFGTCIQIINISDIMDLQMQMSGTDLYLTWEWPAGLQKVLILYRHDRFPSGINDSQAAKRTLSRQEYELFQAFMIKDANTECYYFRIHAVVEDGSDVSYSHGVKLQTVKTVIRYDLDTHRRFLLFGNLLVAIRLSIESGELRFPGLVVKMEKGHPPLNRDYGMPIINIPPSDEKTLTVPIDSEHCGEKVFIRVFVADSLESDFFLMDAPPPRELELHWKKPTFRRLLTNIFHLINPFYR